MNFKWLIAFIVVLYFASCTNNVKIRNDKRGDLTASVMLKLSEEKKIVLDSSSAPKPQYTQMFFGDGGTRYFTFLNRYTNSIYFYNYENLQFTKNIVFETRGADGVSILKAYHIKSLDSIYLYNRNAIEIIMANDKGKVLNRFSLRANRSDPNWGFIYPQYNPQTVMPFIETKSELLLSGFFFGAIPNSIIESFKFTSRLNFKTGMVSFSHTYPSKLYGSNYNWDGELFTLVFSELHPDGDKLIYSFPVSHELYIADINSETYRKVYAGSNFAKTIHSINSSAKRVPNEKIMTHIIEQDAYTAIKYDKFRKVYYRFLLKSASATDGNMRWQKKPIVIIIMDEDFNYLGETEIGTGEDWYWQNSFVTKEGLNIEYIEKDFEEVYLTLKIFTIEKI